MIVIGESMNRNHLGLYGYTRNTTPQLNKIRDQLIMFENTTSAYSQTKPSLSVALTEVDADEVDRSDQVMSLMEVFKKAGYKTWWISNQQPSRYPTTPMAALADERHFISHDFYGVESYRYDGYMTPYIEQALQDTSSHKVIFVHLMGSHLHYESRYPKETFSQFSTRDNLRAFLASSELSDAQVETINQYDNSIYYTDSLLGEWIEKLTKTSNNHAAALVFFADHGEEVFDSRDFKGHAPDGVTRHMLEIPHLVWRNQAYQREFSSVNQSMKDQVTQPFLLDDFFHFAICVAQIKTDLYKPERSVCDASFKPKARIIYGKAYEEYLD